MKSIYQSLKKSKLTLKSKKIIFNLRPVLAQKKLPNQSIIGKKLLDPNLKTITSFGPDKLQQSDPKIQITS